MSKLFLLPLRKPLPSLRMISTSAPLPAVQSGRFKVSIKHNNPLTYEQANKPHDIGGRKEWNSFNTENHPQFATSPSPTVISDMFIRKFISGTWHDLFVSEITIKRQANLIRIGGIVQRSVHVRKVYWLIGYCEEMLGAWLQCVVKMEVVSVEGRREVVFKFV